MFSNINISTATIQDIPSLVKLINSAYRGEESKKGWTTEAFLIAGESRIDNKSLEEIILQDDADLVIYKNNDAVIEGSVYLHKKENKLYLGMFAVNPNVQSSGIGKKMLQAAEHYAREKKCTAIFMTVISVRVELIAWYERHGYMNTEVKSPFPSDGRFGKAIKPLEFITLEKTIQLINTIDQLK